MFKRNREKIIAIIDDTKDQCWGFFALKIKLKNASNQKQFDAYSEENKFDCILINFLTCFPLKINMWIILMGKQLVYIQDEGKQEFSQ